MAVGDYSVDGVRGDRGLGTTGTGIITCGVDDNCLHMCTGLLAFFGRVSKFFLQIQEGKVGGWPGKI